MTAQAVLAAKDLIQAQFDAYNAQDLDAYCAFFTDDVIVADLNGAVSVNGIAAYRAKYEATFAQFPQNKAELVSRMHVGGTVVDHERVVRSPGGETFEIICIYTLAGGKIARVDFAR
ncbi:nuclear transport factor 2 family protein [Phenylobacterium immobile]|uniref:nuclear transport factor 2 family protein n=1 Tax=Phenylobacterium immobile TaxID=21 RepID=UPI000AB13680|nr:nuclear transport factor 2 family protein [Phenylobacterium immobile]